MAHSRASTATIVSFRDYLPDDPDDYWSQPPPPPEKRWGRPSRARLKTTTAHDAIFNAKNVAVIRLEPLLPPERVTQHAPLFPVHTAPSAEPAIPKWLANGRARHLETQRLAAEHAAMLLSASAEEAARASQVEDARESSARSELQHDLWTQLERHHQAVNAEPASNGAFVVFMAGASLVTFIIMSSMFQSWALYAAFFEEAAAVVTWLWDTGTKAFASL